MAERRPKKKYRLPPPPVPTVPQPRPPQMQPLPQLPIQPIPQPIPYPVPVPYLHEYCSVDPCQLWETYQSSKHTTKMLKRLLRHCQSCCPPSPPPCCDGPWSSQTDNEDAQS